MSVEEQQLPAGDDGMYPMRTVASLTDVNPVTYKSLGEALWTDPAAAHQRLHLRGL